jgi:HK97 family phage prohead protease
MSNSELRFTDSKRFKNIQKEGGSPNNVAVRKQYISKSIEQEGGEDSRVFRFTVSTNAVDRDRDTVSPDGFDLDNYKTNPVVLFAHQSDRPPIGRAPDIGTEKGVLKASVEFMNNDIDTSGFSDMMYRMVKNGFIKATSVGFLPIEFDMADNNDEKRAGGMDFTKQELLEFSIVPVPSNPEALIEARSKGIDTEPLQGWFEEALEDWMHYRDMLLVPKKTVEGLYKAASGKTKLSFHIPLKDQDALRRKNLENILRQKVENGEEVSELGEKLIEAAALSGEDHSHIKDLVESSSNQDVGMSETEIDLSYIALNEQAASLKDEILLEDEKASDVDEDEEDDEDEDKSNNETPHTEDDEDPNATPPDRDDESHNPAGKEAEEAEDKGEMSDDDEEDDEDEDKSNNETPHTEDSPLQPNDSPNTEDDHNAQKGEMSDDEEEDDDEEDDDEDKASDDDIVITLDEPEKEQPKAASSIVEKGFTKTDMPHLASRIFNTPLIVDQRKLNTILYVLSDKLGIDASGLEQPAAEELGEEADIRPYHVDQHGVATIPVMGTLVQRSTGLNAMSGLQSYKEIESDFLKALDDDDVKAIALHIDSPGGEVAGCFDLVDTIYEARGEKPIWAIVDETACSAAYAIASAADKIYAPRTADVGSVGVVWLHSDVSRRAKNEGIEYTFIHAGDHKTDGNPYEPLNGDAAKRIQKSIDDTYDIFIETVARNRGISADSVQKTEASVYMGQEATKMGLIDDVSSSRSSFRKLANIAKEMVQKDDISDQIVEYSAVLEEIQELKSVIKGLQAPPAVETAVEVKEKQEDSQSDYEDTQKLVTELLPEVLPDVIKDVLRGELRKIKGQVD